MCKDMTFEKIAFEALKTQRYIARIFMIVVIIEVLANIAMNIYWANRFFSYNYETVVIDGTDGSTNAYIEGDNNTINNKEK